MRKLIFIAICTLYSINLLNAQVAEQKSLILWGGAGISMHSVDDKFFAVNSSIGLTYNKKRTQLISNLVYENGELNNTVESLNDTVTILYAIDFLHLDLSYEFLVLNANKHKLGIFIGETQGIYWSQTSDNKSNTFKFGFIGGLSYQYNISDRFYLRLQSSYCQFINTSNDFYKNRSISAMLTYGVKISK